jgi:hypothetical protein
MAGILILFLICFFGSYVALVVYHKLHGPRTKIKAVIAETEDDLRPGET